MTKNNEDFLEGLLKAGGISEGGFTKTEEEELTQLLKSYKELKQYYDEQNEVNKQYIHKKDVIDSILSFIGELKHDNMYSDSGMEARDLTIQFLMDYIVKLL